jgi:peroxiredoxin Q/BCP
MLQIGDNAPLFKLLNAQDQIVSLSDFKGQWIVLYFYPKDNTSGCTREAKEFTEIESKFKKKNTKIIGISPDSPKSHRSFIEKQTLSIELLSDPEHKTLIEYGVWQKKKLYGKEYDGVVRTTFLINPEGTIKNIWEKVKVDGHVNEVYENLCSF